MLSLLFALLSLSWAAHVEYNLGIQTDEGVTEWGVIAFDPKKPSLLEFSPSELTHPPSSGCLGVQSVDGFQCQTMFKNIDTNERRATLAWISPLGKLSQVQLIDGKRSAFRVEVPSVAPSFEFKRQAPPKAKAKSKKSGKPMTESRAYKAPTDDEDDENLSFFEKNWKLVALGAVVLAVNVFKPKPPTEEAS